MEIVTLDVIQNAVTNAGAIEAVRRGYIAYSDGLIGQPDPMQILFREDDGRLFGDCHAKAAHWKGVPYFVLKIATGFYRNAEKDLPANSGLMLILSSVTGRPLALLRDDGWLTQIRTAAAGALAASLRPVTEGATLGVIGTGTQAFLQAQMITEQTGIRRILVKGRNREKSTAFAARLRDIGIDATAASSTRTLCDTSAIVVTTTPSSEPVLTYDDVTGPIHIVAVGADSPGKLEIDPRLTARAQIIATDNHTQCLHHGDFGAAVRAGLLPEQGDTSLCDILAGKRPEADFGSVDISMVDLTGVGVQDLAMATLVLKQLGLDSIRGT